MALKKSAVKEAAVKAEPAKEEPAKAVSAETEPAKAEPAKAAEAKKEEAPKKTSAAKKAPAKKVEPKASVIIEYAGNQIVAKDVLAAATKAFKASNKGVTIKTIEVYVKPEENVAYYVVNGEGSDDYKVSL